MLDYTFGGEGVRDTVVGSVSTLSPLAGTEPGSVEGGSAVGL